MSLKLDKDFETAPVKLKASLWNSQRILLTPKELERLFQDMPPFEMFALSFTGPKEGFYQTKEQVLKIYTAYFESLFSKKDRSFHQYKKQLTLAWTAQADALYLSQPSTALHLIHMCRPVVYCTLCVLHYDSLSKKILYSDHGEKAMRLGLEIKFPKFYQDPTTLQPIHHLKDSKNPNTRLFKALQKWCRDHAQVVFFETKDTKERYCPACKVGQESLHLLQNMADLETVEVRFHSVASMN